MEPDKPVSRADPPSWWEPTVGSPVNLRAAPKNDRVPHTVTQATMSGLRGVLWAGLWYAVFLLFIGLSQFLILIPFSVLGLVIFCYVYFESGLGKSIFIVTCYSLGVVIAYALIFSLIDGVHPGLAVFYSLSGAGCAALAVSLICIIYTFTIGIAAFLLVSLFNKSMENIWSPLTAAGIAGGLAGFIPFVVLPIDLGWPYFFVLGMLVPMVLGQIFATWVAGYELKKWLGRPRLENRQTVARRLDPPLSETGWKRFGIRQMFVLTAWVAVLTAILTPLSQKNIYIQESVFCFCAWFVVQPVVFLIVNTLMRPWIRTVLAEVEPDQQGEKP